MGWLVKNYTYMAGLEFIAENKEEFTRLVIQRVDGITFSLLSDVANLVYNVVEDGMKENPDEEQLTIYMQMISAIYQRL
jgi:hypothetical protein